MLFGHVKTILSLRQRYHSSFWCLRPSTHGGLIHTLHHPLCAECIDITLLQPKLHWHSSILSLFMLLDTPKWLYSSDSHAFCLLCWAFHSCGTSTSALTTTTYQMHQQHLTTARTALIFIYSFNINAFGHIKTILSHQQRYHTSFCCVKPSTHAGHTLRFTTHNVQNALTSSYWSQNYTAIHLFFRN
jgi:hypothetical protein